MKNFILILVLLISGLSADSINAQGILALQTNPIGIAETISNQSISVFPNPNYGKFNISLKNSISKIQIEIYNNWGKKIYESSIRSPLSENEIDFSLHPKGVYFIKINDGDNYYNDKIVIQ
jgi:Secretion system C-terminal sorting domain